MSDNNFSNASNRLGSGSKESDKTVTGTGAKPSISEVPKKDSYSSDPQGSSTETTFADELAALKETVAGLVASMGSGAASTIRETGQTIANAASGALDAGASAASYAGDQAKTMANDLEAFARRNPLGAMGGALAIGVLIGMLGRGRH